MLDPNGDFDFEFDGSDLRKDSIKTYKTQSNIFKEYFTKKEDLSTEEYKDDFYIPANLLNDDIISDFFKWDYTNQKENNEDTKYYFRIRKLRGYFNHCLSHHNLHPLHNIKDRRKTVSF